MAITQRIQRNGQKFSVRAIRYIVFTPNQGSEVKFRTTVTEVGQHKPDFISGIQCDTADEAIRLGTDYVEAYSSGNLESFVLR